MGRKRIKDVPALTSWEQVDQALREIAEKERAVVEINGEMNKQIAGIKMTAAQDAKPHQDRIDKLAKDIKEFVMAHNEDMDGKKSKRLNFGEVGFRLSTKVKLPKDKAQYADIVRRLKVRRLRDCIKIEETINRDILRSHGKDVVIAVGAGWTQSNTFWYEVAHDKLEALGE